MNEVKKCWVCGETLPIEDFHVTVKRGKPYTYAHCKPCQRRYGRQHYRDNREYYLDKAARRKAEVQKRYRALQADYLKEHPCVDCGEEDLVVLQFDHVSGTKTANVSNMISNGLPWPLILEEIAKCAVRCANCHARKTAADNGWWSSPL